MQCPSCHEAVSPGMAIKLDGDPTVTPSHCPYCLGQLPAQGSDGATHSQAGNNVSVRRFERRREVRGRFVQRLLHSSPDGAPHCPVCAHRLNKDDELALRSGEHFRCHFCSRDLASMAYREVAYEVQSWLPVMGVVADLQSEPKCADCAYLGAVAKACQHALSCIPKSFPSQDRLIRTVLARHDWKPPSCDDVASCAAVRQYRERVAEGIALL